MRESCAVMVTRRRDEDLGLMFEAPERLAVDYAVAITLIGGTDCVRRFGSHPALRIRRLRREGGEPLPFFLFDALANLGVLHQGVVLASRMACRCQDDTPL